MENLKEIEQKIENLKNELKNELNKIALENKKNIKLNFIKELKVKYLGKKSEVQNFLKLMGNLSEDARKNLGEIINNTKNYLDKKIDENLKKVEDEILAEKLEKEFIDITEPCKALKGSMHPIEKINQEEIKIFTSMGYSVVDGPEIEKTHFVFDMLNTPKDHPARDIQDTFYIKDDIVLRSHTSSVQIRTMLDRNLPIKMICPGAVYRSDSVDATHSPVFHQLEGLVVDKGITMSDLKGTLTEFVKKLLGEDTKIRFRPHHFPYTEPSAEVDVSCFVCNGKGCKVCKGEGWIELLGCGMVHPKVLKDCGIDPEIYSGFAFGLGTERIAMAKYGIDDLRLLYENDVRFLKQFK